MRRHSRRLPASLPNRVQPRPERLEARLLLACDMRVLDDGTLLIAGDDAAQILTIEDRGYGEVSVLCEERGVEPAETRVFSGVTGIQGDLRGGNDVLNYTSNQDVNAALPQLEFLMGEGNDRANVEATVNGTPSRSRGFGFVTMGGPGNDVLVTKITTLTTSDNSTEPVVHGELHGGEGRDALTLISTTGTGGFTLTSRELTPSTEGTVTQPGCLIWDLIDGTSGVVNAQVMGSEVDERIELRSDASGIGRSHFDFAMDGGGGVNALDVYMTLEADTQGDVNGSCQIWNVAEQGWEIDGILELSASASASAGINESPIAASRFGISIDGVQSAATLDLVGSAGHDDVNVHVRESRLSNLAISVDARGGNDPRHLRRATRVSWSRTSCLSAVYPGILRTSRLLGFNSTPAT